MTKNFLVDSKQLENSKIFFMTRNLLVDSTLKHKTTVKNQAKRNK
jgi:hypothetical protein